MNILFRVFLIFTLIFSSCSQLRNINNSDSPESFYSKINKAVDGKTITIIATSGDSYEGTDLTVSFDSTKWVLESSDERMIYPTDQIHKIRIKDHLKGAVGGLTIGLIAGLGVAVTAIVVHLNSGESEAGDFAPAVYLLSGVSIGAFVGSGIGAAMGHKYEYIMNPLIE